MISAFVTFGFLSSLSSLGLLWQQRRDRKQRQGQLLFFFLVLTLVLLVDPFLYIQHVHGFLNVPIVLKHALRNPRGGRGGVELHKNNHNSRHSTPCVFRTNSDGCGDSSLSVSGRPSRLWLRQRHGLVAKTTSSLFQMKKTDDTHVAVLLDQSSSPSNLPPMMQHSSLIGGLGGQVLTLLVVAYKFMTRPLYYFWHQFLSLTNGQKLLLGAVFGIGFAFGRVRPFWKRYIQVADIPSSMFGPYAPVLVGRAVSVTDGDTIRFLHRPTPFHPTSLSPGQKKSEFALPIRLCSIDTPETAKFGKPGQPYGEEAKQVLAELLHNRPVFIRLLHKDQYGRGVAQVFVRGKALRRPIYADEHLLKLGMAEVYRGGGAVYGPKGLETYNVLEQTAQAHHVGMWSQGAQRESAADYKKRTKID